MLVSAEDFIDTISLWMRNAPCAWKTLGQTRSCRNLSQYPHVGRLKDKYDFRFYAESSPHARGTPFGTLFISK